MSDHQDKKTDLLGLLPEEIDAVLERLGLETYRSAQILDWLYRHGAHSFGEMTNVPKRLREELARRFRITHLEPLRIQSSELDRTKKYLLGLAGGATVEAVLLPEGDRSTACVSTQVGCSFGCAFCASGEGGLTRNLSTGEIVEQARTAKFDPDAGRLANVVLMGMGEPLANYDATAKAVRIFLHEHCFALGKRRITISTAGYVPGMLRLADDKLPVRLAVSLHAADNAIRDRLMPINRKYPIEKVIDACRRLSRNHRMPLTIEYMLIDGENDSLEQARKLNKICRMLDAKVNLIPYNPARGDRFGAPSQHRLLSFQSELKKAGVLAFIRRSRGRDIDAACGQLRAGIDAKRHPRRGLQKKNNLET